MCNYPIVAVTIQCSNERAFCVKYLNVLRTLSFGCSYFVAIPKFSG